MAYKYEMYILHAHYVTFRPSHVLFKFQEDLLLGETDCLSKSLHDQVVHTVLYHDENKPTYDFNSQQLVMMATGRCHDVPRQPRTGCFVFSHVTYPEFQFLDVEAGEQSRQPPL